MREANVRQEDPAAGEALGADELGETNGSIERHGGDSMREKDLRLSERRFRTVIEQSSLSIHVLSPEGHSLLANSSWNELWYLGEGEEPEGRSTFEDEQLRAPGLIPYVEEGLAGSAVTPPRRSPRAS